MTFSRIAEPSAPDWQKKPARPRGGISPDRLALIDTSGSVLMMPSALGPISRTPYERESPTSRRCRCRPSSPVSAKPEEITTRPCTPLAAQSRTTSSTASAGTATIATSTSSWMSVTLVYVGSPDTARALGFTAYTRPVKSPVTRLRTSAWPMVSWRRLAPMTATDAGLKKRWMLAASATCSRPCMMPIAVSVGSIGNSSWRTPSS